MNGNTILLLVALVAAAVVTRKVAGKLASELNVDAALLTAGAGFAAHMLLRNDD